MSRARRAAAAAAALAVAAALAAAGCGSSAGDLIAIEVSGGPARVNERIRVTDDGRAGCGDGRLRALASQQVLDARQVKRALKPLAKRGASYGSHRPGRRRYVARSVDGSVSWTEGAPGPPALARATLLALRLERRLCRG
ncbi:MAG TPA: hypothetical protein VF545_12540 [Thermoleophilaceae bacterium]|jgi:hypothetical protein